MIEAFVKDARYAIRGLQKQPAFTFAAVMALALGIGATTTIFSVIENVLLDPYPMYADVDRIVGIQIRDLASARPGGREWYPVAEFLDYQTQAQSFDEVIAGTGEDVVYSSSAGSEQFVGGLTSGNTFTVLGVPAAIGRTLTPEDARPGAPPVFVLSYKLWSTRFGLDPSIVGKSFVLNGVPTTLIGVMPARVSKLGADLWRPVRLDPADPALNGHYFRFQGRLKRGVTLEQAQAEMEVIAQRVAKVYPRDYPKKFAVRVVGLIDSIVGSFRKTLYTMAAAVGLLLLIACANVASMLLARASGRQKEIGIRLAIGASRARLVQQLVTEAIVLSMLGAVGGTLLAWWLTSVIASASLPLPIPIVIDLRLDGRVLAFTLGTTFCAGLLAGLAPAIQALKPSVTADLRGEAVAPSVGGRRWAMRDGLVAGQMAVTALLLVVAALLTRSLIAAQRTDAGFAVNRLAVLSTDTAMLRYSVERSGQFYDQAMTKVMAIPGVESAALATRVPLQVNANRWEIWIPQRHQPGGHGDTVEVTTVSTGYFRTMGVSILEGRGFTDDDRIDTPRVAVVNETFARRFWPGESAIGKTFRTRGSDGPLFQIVGVSTDHKVLTLSEPPTPFLHVARAQRPNSYTAIIARTRGDSASLLRDMRREMLALEPNLVFVENQTMEAEVDATLLPMRASAWLVGGVGLVAMLLAAIGLYGVIAYSVARRTREIGIRMALGARPESVIRLVLRQGLLVAAAGLAGGCLLAAIAARLIAGALYGVSAADPVSWASAAVVLLVASALANLIPAWRAARVTPSEALRTE